MHLHEPAALDAFLRAPRSPHVDRVLMRLQDKVQIYVSDAERGSQTDAVFETLDLLKSAIAEGVQSLLRESLVDNFNKYSDRGFCPIYAKESIKKVYAAYHQLGGNDVATELYNKLLKMKEETGNED